MTLPGHSSFRGKLKFSPDGKRLVAAGYTPGLELWDLGTREHVR